MSDLSHNSKGDLNSQPIIPDNEKMQAMAEFAAGAGHEINNPLATIIGRAQLLLQGETDPQRRQMLMAIGAQAYRIRDMIGDAMLFARPPAPCLDRTNLSSVSAKVCAALAESCRTARCQIRLSVPETMELMADPTQLATVLQELLKNSIRASRPDGGAIELSAVIDQSHALMTVVDRGTEWSEIERRHAFDPFFSGRQAGRGLGFGLSKCWRIIDQHQGRIEIENAPERTTIVRVWWPLAN